VPGARVEQESALARAKPDEDGALPSGNAVAAVIAAGVVPSGAAFGRAAAARLVGSSSVTWAWNSSRTSVVWRRNSAIALPRVRATFVAPMFPDPAFRRSRSRSKALATSMPNGTDPTR